MSPRGRRLRQAEVPGLRQSRSILKSCSRPPARRRRAPQIVLSSVNICRSSNSCLRSKPRNDSVFSNSRSATTRSSRSNRGTTQGGSSRSSNSASSKLNNWRNNGLRSSSNRRTRQGGSSWNSSNASSKLNSWRNNALKSSSNSRQGNKRTRQEDSSWKSSTSNKLNNWRSSTLRRCSSSRNSNKNRGASWKLKPRRVIRSRRDHPTRSPSNSPARPVQRSSVRRVNVIRHSPFPYSYREESS